MTQPSNSLIFQYYQELHQSLSEYLVGSQTGAPLYTALQAKFLHKSKGRLEIAEIGNHSGYKLYPEIRIGIVNQLAGSQKIMLKYQALAV